MEQIVVKTEMQPDGNILLFYVDENTESERCLLEPHDIQPEAKYIIEDESETKYIIEDDEEDKSGDELDLAHDVQQVIEETWPEEEISRLIIFYIDNKATFLNGSTKRKYLWSVACRTTLTDKTPLKCEVKFRMLRKKYIETLVEKQKGGSTLDWPLYEVCHQAFHDDSYVTSWVNEPLQPEFIDVPVPNVIVEDVKTKKTAKSDEKVEAMLNLYLKHKTLFPKNHLTKNVWETIALELGNEDGEYWHKRFLNFKQHYIRMLYKRKESESTVINWPYMQYFDKIFADDDDFQSRFLLNENNEKMKDIHSNEIDRDNVWYNTEKTFLAKYYFDCFHEFQDPTIPDKFLWHEVGRLLNKSPEKCENKFKELKGNHFKVLLEGGYVLDDRVPLEILLDSIIALETESILTKLPKNYISNESWITEQVDELVQYLYDNMVMLKDPICYYVCWATIARKLNRTIPSCRKQWNDLTKLYNSILNDKKENPDMHIDWRYIDVFDRIFDYGMDTKLLDGYEKLKELNQHGGKIGVKRIAFKDSDENVSEYEESYDERGFTKHTNKHTGDEKAFKILEYYLKNKDKFGSSQQRKLALWDVIGKQIGVSATECAHRFRNFKQVYMAYVQREINKPEMPILWPYYSLCKKVFGYRAIKTKLKNSKKDSDEIEDWTAKEIKQVINHFSNNYSELVNNMDDTTLWSDLAQEMGRPALSLRDKFLELRKSYRKLKTMKSRNPDVKLSWKYFNMMDNVYNKDTTVNSGQYLKSEIHQSFEIIGKTETQDDEDYQCIIVLPEGEEMFYDDENIEETVAEEMHETLDFRTDMQPKMFKWNKQSKKKLLNLYLDFLRTHNGQRIKQKEMWTKIASKLDDKTPKACRNMFLKLERNYDDKTVSPYNKLLKKIFNEKENNEKKSIDEINISNIYKDEPMDDDKVSKALNYYLQNLEDFVNPRFDVSYLWNDLSKLILEPVDTITNKINYLKNNSKKELPYADILQKILAQENELKYEINKQENLSPEDVTEDVWSDIETERLLTWYLAHLDKFKNPSLFRSYLWMEASDILKKSPIVCSKKMSEIRFQYRSMVKENPEGLKQWKFYNLCQRIYGTGKKAINNI